jgi:HTH-type transcriptional regulator/antitoxin HipB
MQKSPSLAKLIKFHRKKAQLTQARLAELAGVGKTTVFDIENGKINVQFNIILSVLEILNIKLVFESPIMHLMENENV